ncbi:MAG: signal recognition particle-docking protein FtsY [Treponema sp.]|jgi:fused signal recognition particle receptor|nr:signal recognition particle-docking protein FtsY [Treponema sp.]
MGIGEFRERLRAFFAPGRTLSEELFEDLSDLLVEGDFGAREACETADRLREYCRKEKLSEAGEVREALARLLEDLLRKAPAFDPESLFGIPGEGDPAVILLLGVNGAGKTTTAAKLAARYQDRYQLKPVFAAADTFRAAAVDQLKIHGERLAVRVVAHRSGGDPAAVVYDALEAARSGGGNPVIVDTAGRMHTKSALVEELRKIDRVVESRASRSRYVKYLVLDATTGRNAVTQAEIFTEAVSPDGAILTKYDSSARGGAVFSLASALKLPVAYICEGEKYGDIRPFEPRLFAREFAGLA